MKVEAREIGDFSQLRAVQRLIEVRVDVVEHTVDAACVLGAGGLGGGFGGHGGGTESSALRGILSNRETDTTFFNRVGAEALAR